MSKITYNADLLRIMFLFESITGTKLKDCFIDNNSMLTFVVQENQIGKAIGKKAVNVRKLEGLLKRRIKIVEFNSSVCEFVKNLLAPLKDVEVSQDNETIIISGDDSKTKALLIGRNSQNLKNTENIIKKYFNIGHVKVV